MKWDANEGYYIYKSNLTQLQDALGINTVDWDVRQELAPYLTKILQYLNREIIDRTGESGDMSQKLQVIFDIALYGADMIVSNQSYALAQEVGVTDESDNNNPSSTDGQETDEGDVLDDDIPEDDETPWEGTTPYVGDRFVFSWANVLGTLVTRLKIQYASLLYEPTAQGCPCCCGYKAGDSQKDLESWTSGVYPEDEEYSTAPTQTATTVMSRNECGCNYRKS